MEKTDMEQYIKGKMRHIQQQLMYAIILKSPDKTDNYTTKPTCNGPRTIQQISTAQKAGAWGPMRTPKTWKHIPDLELY